MGTHCAPGGIGAAFGRVWLTDGLAEVYSLNPRLGHFTKLPDTAPADAITTTPDYVYAADTNSVALIYPLQQPTVQLVPNTLTIPLGIAANQDGVWVAAPVGKVIQLDPLLGQPGSTSVAQGDDKIAVGAGAIWVTNSRTYTLTRLRPGKNLSAIWTKRIGTAQTTLTDVAVGRNNVWVTIADPRDLTLPR